MSSLEHLLEKYAQHVSGPAFLPETVDEFLHIRSDIALELIANDGVIDAAQLAAINDDAYIAALGIELPPLLEAVQATQKCEAVAKKVVGELAAVAQAVIVSGSANWGKYYSIRYSDHKKSDVDIDVIFDDYSDELALGYPELKYELELYQKCKDEYQAEMLMSKIDIDGITASLHYIPLDKLQGILRYPYETATEPFALRAFRTELPNRPVQQYGPTYNFAHEPYHYDLQPQAHEHGYTTGQPFMMVGSQGEIVMAVSLHKLIVLSQIYGPMQTELQTAFADIFQQFANRKEAERELLNTDPSFSKLLARFPLMPKFVQAKVYEMDNL